MEFSNKQVVELLRKVVIAYKIHKRDFFKVAAYEKAADSIELLSESIFELWKAKKLDGIDGVGPVVKGNLEELFTTGKIKSFDKELADIPNTVFLLVKIPKLGPIRAYTIVTTFKLFDEKTVLKKVIELCKKHEIAKLPRYGEKLEKAIWDSVEQFQSAVGSSDRIPYDYAKTVADDIMTYLRNIKGVQRVEAMGSLRRKTPTIGDIDIAVVADDKDSPAIVKHFIAYPKKVSVDNAGDAKASIYLPPNLRIDLRVHPKKAYGALLQYFTGSKAHNIKLREWALRKGYSLNEYGLKDLRNSDQGKAPGKDSNTIIFDTEEKLYNFLGLKYIPPEERTGGDEIEKAVIKK